MRAPEFRLKTELATLRRNALNETESKAEFALKDLEFVAYVSLPHITVELRFSHKLQFSHNSHWVC